MNKLRESFEMESGYNFKNCNSCINNNCKFSGLCDYWEKYSKWLEKYIICNKIER